MEKLGELAKLYILPLKLAWYIIGGYCAYSFIVDFHYLASSLRPQIFKPNGLGHILLEPPSFELIDRAPEVIGFLSFPFVFNLFKIQIWLRGLNFIATLFNMLFGGAWVYYLQSIGSALYSSVTLLISLHVLRIFRNGFLLEETQLYSNRQSVNLLFFGVLHWPNTFWYRFLISSFFNGLFLINVINIYYSLFLIDKAGGSGWEGLSAQQLPGWQKYQSKLEKARKSSKPQKQQTDEQTPLDEEQMLLANREFTQLLQEKPELLKVMQQRLEAAFVAEEAPKTNAV